eukprot:TRINITY_DN54824_c0_g1_i1.p1 TRINITY_DN54824_c0_g1~~TRINITY_DN54824_c0_g1_i1.p1  ORF type:complete len:432 (-),score=63.37 TRINITY_DN54824_c0_g1_i1:495-1610(-)
MVMNPSHKPPPPTKQPPPLAVAVALAPKGPPLVKPGGLMPKAAPFLPNVPAPPEDLVDLMRSPEEQSLPWMPRIPRAMPPPGITEAMTESSLSLAQRLRSRHWVLLNIAYLYSPKTPEVCCIGYFCPTDAYTRADYAIQRIMEEAERQLTVRGWPIQRLTYTSPSGSEEEIWQNATAFRRALEAWIADPAASSFDLQAEVHAAVGLSGGFHRMWTSRKFSDMVLVAADGTEFACHRAVLASVSPVFDSMLTHSLREGVTARVELDWVPADVVNSFLVAVYLDQLRPADVTNATLQQLLKLGEMYDMPPLVKTCAEQLAMSVDENNVVEVLQCLATYRDTNDIVKDAFKSIMETLSKKPELLEVVCLHAART